LLLAQSNRFIDNSTNNFTVTRNGDTLVSGFEPFVPNTSYSTYGSTYFDGTGDSLTIPSSTPNQFGSGDFTLETWYYSAGSIATSGQQLFFRRATASAIGLIFQVDSSKLNLLAGDSNTAAWEVNLSSATTLVANTWYHFAASRSGSTWRIFINGAVEGTATASFTIAEETANISIGSSITGYLSNLRAVKGTALYTSAFTPPTTPLTAVSGTSLLTLQTNQPNNNNMFLDSSTNNFLITRNGNTTQGTFSPYGAGWSNYFDGTGDYLTVPNNSAFLFGSGNFTVEAWCNIPAMGAERWIAGFWSYTIPGNQSWALYAQNANSGYTFLIQGDQGAEDYVVLTVANSVVLNQWTHVAVTRSGSTWRMFINGTLSATTTYSGTLANCSNVLGIGVVENAPAAYVGYISNLRIVKGTAVYTSTFTPSNTPLQPISGTSLLTCADNRFVDDSPNNFTVSRFADASIQRFSPFAGTTLPTPYYSGYFNGGTNRLTTSSSSLFNLTSSSITLECWVYMTAAPSVYIRLITIGPNNAQSSLYLGITTGRVLEVSVPFGSGGAVTSGANLIPLNTWTHLAFVLSGSTGTIYINGTQVGQSGSWNITSTSSNYFYIGYDATATVDGKFTGYISNVRLLVGTALYTGAFTPSATPLQPIANTILLTCQSATFTDNSTNAFSITAIGNSQPSLFSPFTVTYSTKQLYSPAVIGGSMYFDGSGDWLVTTTSPATLSGSFTIEAWVYITSLAASRSIVCVGDDNTSTGALFFVNTSGRLAIYGNGGNILVGTSQTVAVNTWNHIAFVRSSGTITAYLNGVADSTTASNSTAFTGANRIGGELFAGNAGGTIMLGYISNYRLVNGTAVYTSSFAPPVALLTAVSNSVLLLNGTSAGILDGSAMANFETVGGAQISTSIKKYSTGSIYFDGTGDYLATNSTLITNFGAGLFTIESWVYFNSVSGTQYIMSTYQDSGTGWALGLFNSKFNFWATGDGADIVGTTTPVINTWYHLAVSGQTGSIKLFVNGIQEGSTYTGATALNSTSTLRIGDGAGAATGQAVNGYLDDLRITRGAARYTTTFTPPSGAFGGK
jgi:hypothetical protein